MVPDSDTRHQRPAGAVGSVVVFAVIAAESVSEKVILNGNAVSGVSAGG